MNQILYTIENEEEKNRIKSIILFFAITIIIFGIILTTMGGYQIALSAREKAEAIEAAKVPEIALSVEDNKVIITVNHTREISDIIYSWNDEEETTLEENTSEEITETINVPAGTNTFNVTAIDIQGKTSTISQEVTYIGTYMDLAVVANKSLKITVTDMEGLQSVTYKWNSGEETTAYPDAVGDTVIEITTDIPIGYNTITVTAVNNNNEIETKEQPVQGITRPTISPSYDSGRTKLIINLSDEQGIESYSYSLKYAAVEDIAKNGELIENYEEKLTLYASETIEANGEKTITFTLPFQEGFNYLEVKVTNIEGAEESTSGWCSK